MKDLQTIKDEYAVEQGFTDFNEMFYDEGYEIGEMGIDEIAKRYVDQIIESPVHPSELIKQESNSFDQNGEVIKEQIPPMTWKDMKEFCATLTEEQLKEKVIVWRESECINNLGACQLDEDQFVDKENAQDGCFDQSERDWQIENADAHADDFEKVYSKGHPILWENF